MMRSYKKLRCKKLKNTNDLQQTVNKHLMDIIKKRWSDERNFAFKMQNLDGFFSSFPKPQQLDVIFSVIVPDILNNDPTIINIMHSDRLSVNSKTTLVKYLLINNIQLIEQLINNEPEVFVSDIIWTAIGELATDIQKDLRKNITINKFLTIQEQQRKSIMSKISEHVSYAASTASNNLNNMADEVHKYTNPCGIPHGMPTAGIIGLASLSVGSGLITTAFLSTASAAIAKKVMRASDDDSGIEARFTTKTDPTNIEINDSYEEWEALQKFILKRQEKTTANMLFAARHLSLMRDFTSDKPIKISRHMINDIIPNGTNHSFIVFTDNNTQKIGVMARTTSYIQDEQIKEDSLISYENGVRVSPIRVFNVSYLEQAAPKTKHPTEHDRQAFFKAGTSMQVTIKDGEITVAPLANHGIKSGFKHRSLNQNS